MTTPRHLHEYQERGFTIVDDLMPPGLLERLVPAARRAAEKVRTGAVIDDAEKVRLGTGGAGVEPDFISGVMAPEFGEPSFAEYLGSEPLAASLEQFLGPDRRLGWVRLCAIRDSYDGAWHRDTGGRGSDDSYDSEMEVLRSFRSNFLKWHTALIDDPCLVVVSHFSIISGVFVFDKITEARGKFCIFRFQSPEMLLK